MDLGVRAIPDIGVHTQQSNDPDVVPGLFRDFANNPVSRMLTVVNPTARRPPAKIRHREPGQQDGAVLVHACRVGTEPLNTVKPVFLSHPVMVTHDAATPMAGRATCCGTSDSRV